MKVTMNIRTDAEVKEQAMLLFESLGLDLSTAVNIFLRQAILKQGIPFEITKGEPNDESVEALEEVAWLKAHPEGRKSYSDVGLMMKELLNEV